MRQSIYYDRRVSSELCRELGPGGALFALVTIARERHLMDLQLRSYPFAPNRCWATLYCGLTKFVDVFERGGLLTLDAHASYKNRHPEVRWRQPMKPDECRAHWKTVAAYIDAEIRNVPERFTRVGAVQAMLCVNAG